MPHKLENQLRALIEQETSRDLSSYNLDDDLFAELALDSLEGLALLAKIEKRFDIIIPNEDLSDARTLRAILSHLTI